MRSLSQKALIPPISGRVQLSNELQPSESIPVVTAPPFRAVGVRSTDCYLEMRQQRQKAQRKPMQQRTKQSSPVSGGAQGHQAAL